MFPSHVWLVVHSRPESEGGMEIHGVYKSKIRAEAIVRYHKARKPYENQWMEVSKWKIRE